MLDITGYPCLLDELLSCFVPSLRLLYLKSLCLSSLSVHVQAAKTSMSSRNTSQAGKPSRKQRHSTKQRCCAMDLKLSPIPGSTSSGSTRGRGNEVI